jgi:hypothetical protein
MCTEFVGPLGRHGCHLQTIELRFASSRVFTVFKKIEKPAHVTGIHHQLCEVYEEHAYHNSQKRNIALSVLLRHCFKSR